eukprot:UN01934
MLQKIDHVFCLIVAFPFDQYKMSFCSILPWVSNYSPPAIRGTNKAFQETCPTKLPKTAR